MSASLAPPAGPSPSSGQGDALSRVLEHSEALPQHGAIRDAVAEVLARTLLAFTSTHAVVDPLPETAPGSPQEALAVLAGIDQLRSALLALDATWQVTAEQRIREADAAREVATEEQARGAAHEMALARRVSPSTSSLSLAGARRLVVQLPAVHALLAEGRLPEPTVLALTRALDGAEPGACAAVDQWVRDDPGHLDGLGSRRTTRLVRELCQQVDPQDSRRRAEHAARARHVTMTPLGDGMARLTATLRVLDAAAVMHALGTAAEAQQAAGARDHHGALQADRLVAAIVDGPAAGADRPTSRARLDVGVVITDRALLGREDGTECAQIPGYGTVPAHIVTDTLRGRPPGSITQHGESWNRDEHPDEHTAAVFRRLYTHPSTGELVAMESTARAFPVGLARMIRWRDQTCRAPWCNAQIRHLDHIPAHAAGGPTSYGNGQGLCARCNYLREHGPWVVRSPGPYTAGDRATAITWTSPHGARGSSSTPRSEPPLPPPSPPPPPPPPRVPATWPCADDPPF